MWAPCPFRQQDGGKGKSNFAKRCATNHSYAVWGGGLDVVCVCAARVSEASEEGGGYLIECTIHDR